MMSDDDFLMSEPWLDPGSLDKGGVIEVPQEWEPKLRYPDFWTIPEGKREGLERHEMSVAESSCWRARKFHKSCAAFGKGKNVP